MRSGLLALAAVLGALALPISASAANGIARGADAIEVVGSERLSPRLTELRLRTPAVEGTTGLRVLLPEGYRDRPRRRYPVLYLLHGCCNGAEGYRSWTENMHAEAVTAGVPLIVVMPESGSGGGYVDWYNGGAFGPPAWETFHISQLIGWIDDRYRTIAARRGRALAGLSMGGGGAMTYAARHPGRFVHAAAFSGAVDLTHYSLVALGLTGLATNGELENPVFGPWPSEEIRWRATNPVDLAENLRGMRLSLRIGNGLPGGEYGGAIDPIELAVWDMSMTLHERLEREGIGHVWDEYGPGAHTAPYWERDLRLELPRIMATFRDPPLRPRRFSFKAAEPTYGAHRWRVRIQRPALEFSRLEVRGRHGFLLSGSGDAVVRTAPAFRPGRRYRVTLNGSDGGSSHEVTADRRGRLRLAISLGPANESQQYALASAAEGHRVYTTAVRVKRR